MAEVTPVDLRLLARQRAQPQVGLGRRARAHAGDEVAEVRRRCRRSRARPPWRTAAPAVSVGNLASVSRMNGRYGSMRLGRSGEPCTGAPVAGEHAPHGVAMHVQLARDGAHAPLLDRVQAQDLRHQVRGYGHGAAVAGVTAWRTRPQRGALAQPAGAERRQRQHVPQRRRLPARRHGGVGRGDRWRCRAVHAASGAAATPGWEPWCVTLCVASPLLAAAARRLAPASRSLRRGRCGRGASAGSAARPRAAQRHAPGASRPAAVAVAAVAAAAQHDLDAAARAQEQAGGTVHRAPRTPKCWTDVVPARHTAVAPPSSARCRARHGRQASRRERPLPCPPSSASTRVVLRRPSAITACRPPCRAARQTPPASITCAARIPRAAAA